MNEQTLVTLNEAQLRLIVAEAVNEALAARKQQHIQQTILLRRKDVALFFQVKQSTLCKWMQEGLIPYYKIGNRVYFIQREVIAALRSAIQTPDRKAA